MLLEQATRETQPAKPLRDGDLRLLTPTGREVLARYLAGGRIAFAVDRAADIRQVLAYAERSGVHPVIIGGAQAWKVAALLAKSKVPVVLDPFADLPGTFDQLGATLENAARLHRAGVPVVFTHFSMPTHAAHKVRHGAGLAVAHGLPWDAALAALTATPAQVFGLGTELGRIAPGYSADLVLWSGDPLEVTTVAEQVWIEGRPQSMRSRQTELRDRYRPATTPGP
jgi:imidazolonepropionase-like amidohydrolase